ncbi:MAG TPA: M48 family metallopeptidase [bacterium]|jgi:hypothetical protein|nr:M48 family metallopeptidase [bacterium]HQL34805.1 M48 family metallopeptidase [bacterium]HQO11317.1 M48 family metallopeptidase [bacterium]
MSEIKIILKRVRRSRHLRLSIGADGSVLLTRPFWVSEKAARYFLNTKADWLKAQWQKGRASDDNYFRRGGREDYLRNKEKARALVVPRLDYFNQFYNFKFRRLSIRDQRSRWGSCSRNGGLNFNYRLVFLPPNLADYLIVHELCHLGEFNHSPAFWKLVARTIPDYENRRRLLRKL